MARGNVHKASTLFRGDMATSQQWHVKIIATGGHGMRGNSASQFMSGHCRTNGHGCNAKRIRHRVA